MTAHASGAFHMAFVGNPNLVIVEAELLERFYCSEHHWGWTTDQGSLVAIVKTRLLNVLGDKTSRSFEILWGIAESVMEGESALLLPLVKLLLEETLVKVAITVEAMHVTIMLAMLRNVLHHTLERGDAAAAADEEQAVVAEVVHRVTVAVRTANEERLTDFLAHHLLGDRADGIDNKIYMLFVPGSDADGRLTETEDGQLEELTRIIVSMGFDPNEIITTHLLLLDDLRLDRIEEECRSLIRSFKTMLVAMTILTTRHFISPPPLP